MDKQRGQPEASPLSDTERAYLAGIIDGEGSIGIYCRKKGSPNYFLKLAIFNTSEELIKWLNRRVGGATVFHRYIDEHHRPVWIWSIYQDNALAAIKMAEPYMVIKKKQAKLAAAFIKAFRSRKGFKIAESEIAERAAFSQKMMKLNRPHLVVAAAETK